MTTMERTAKGERRTVCARARQGGVALLALLILIAVVGSMVIVSVANSAGKERERHAQSLRAMGTIRDALIARAAADLNRPGSLPCPDYDGDGTADGSLCTSPYIGWVPWKTLDLPDLRDAAGERFWYALSAEFRDHSTLGALNSDTVASLIANGSASPKYIAVILAPNAPLPGQNRDPSNTDALAVRTQYLDGENADGDTEYATGVASDTFNDEVLLITHEMLMPVVEQRVARQARKCLENFSLQAGAGGRFPFAAPLTDVTNFADADSTYYGRVPKTLDATNTALGTTLGWPADDPQVPQIPGPEVTEYCFQTGTWWDYWDELLFYRVALGYAPNAVTPGCGTCLTVNNAGQTKAVVIVAGKAHLSSPTQARSTALNKQIPANYLETAPSPPVAVNNAFGLSTGNLGRRPRAVSYSAATGYFNDRLECLNESGAWPCN
jgi:hypothetical protein